MLIIIKRVLFEVSIYNRIERQKGLFDTAHQNISGAMENTTGQLSRTSRA
jgi:hypothetical protein